jgi:hypothetical protein
MRGKSKGNGAVGSAKNSEVFKNADYKSTSVTFHGQDKGRSGALGGQPGGHAVEDDYIDNLQQQVHFMDLELKILKEKVIEDESHSGIGAMFDDDKTSHQHIDLLKVKYS